jgi:thymidylate kinase
MLWIIEGCDGVGKSTLAHKLKAALGSDAEVRHCSALKRHPLDEYERDLDDSQHHHIIYDRHYLGELVYGPVYRARSEVTPTIQRHIEMYLKSRGAVLVLLTQTTDVIIERCRNKGETFLQEEDVDLVRRMFTEAFMRSGVTYKSLLVDPTEGDVDQLIADAEDAEAEVHGLARFPTYIGSSSPSVLLLGEMRGPRNPGYSACFVPHTGTSGHYLMATINGVGALSNCGIANALEENVPELLEELGNPRVVTLGTAAHRYLGDLEIPHGAVHHPQFVRRFHHAKMEMYGHNILKAARTGAWLLEEGDLS